MSSSDWSSDIETDLNEINEQVAIRVPKSSNYPLPFKSTEVLLGSEIKTKNPSKKFQIELSDQISRLVTSYSPQASIKSVLKTPVKLKPKKLMDLFEEAKSPSRKLVNINERFYKFKEKVRSKIEKLANEQEQIFKKNCPFKPKLIENKRSSRNFKEYLSKIKKFERIKDKNKCFKNNDEGLPTHTPSLCKNSRRLAVKKHEFSSSVYQKLYNERRLIKKGLKIEVLPCFSPTVNLRSHNIKRESTVNDLLYKDALRRQDKRSQSPSYLKQSLVSSHSEKLVKELNPRKAKLLKNQSFNQFDENFYKQLEKMSLHIQF